MFTPVSTSPDFSLYFLDSEVLGMHIRSERIWRSSTDKPGELWSVPPAGPDDEIAFLANDLYLSSQAIAKNFADFKTRYYQIKYGMTLRFGPSFYSGQPIDPNIADGQIMSPEAAQAILNDANRGHALPQAIERINVYFNNVQTLTNYGNAQLTEEVLNYINGAMPTFIGQITFLSETLNTRATV